MKSHPHLLRHFRIAAFAAALSGLVLHAGAANKYVRAGSSGLGTGDDWTNAYASLPASLVRGNTYYIATGTYASHTFEDPDSGTTPITLRKATVADHGTATGWNDSYGTGEAVFTSSGTTWTFSTDYYVIDGVFGYGKSPHGFGFRVFSTAGRDARVGMVVWGGSGPNHCSFNHIEFDWNNGTAAGPRGTTYTFISGAIPCGYITWSFCFFHDGTGYYCYLGQWSGAQIRPITDHPTFDHCYFYNLGGGGGPEAHWEAFWFTDTHNLVFSNNVVENVFGAYPGAGDGQTGWLMMGACSNMSIYGNVFYTSYPKENVIGGNGVIATWSSDKYQNNGIYIINNTFADLKGGYGPHFLFTHNTNTDLNVVCENNIYYGPEDWQFHGVTTQSHEAFGGAVRASGSNSQAELTIAVFNNYASHDYTLASATLPGDSSVIRYISGVSVDMNGSTRGSDGIWDRGAYKRRLDSRACVPRNLYLPGN